MRFDKILTTIMPIALFLIIPLIASAQSNQVSISKNQSAFIAYQSPGAGAMIDEDNLMLEINSADRKHSLVINLFPFGQDEYILTGEGEEGKAVVMLLSDNLRLPLTFAEGVLKFTAIDTSTIGFSITATAIVNQDIYSLNLNFKDIPIRKI